MRKEKKEWGIEGKKEQENDEEEEVEEKKAKREREEEEEQESYGCNPNTPHSTNQCFGSG